MLLSALQFGGRKKRKLKCQENYLHFKHTKFNGSKHLCFYNNVHLLNHVNWLEFSAALFKWIHTHYYIFARSIHFLIIFHSFYFSWILWLFSSQKDTQRHWTKFNFHVHNEMPKVRRTSNIKKVTFFHKQIQQHSQFPHNLADSQNQSGSKSSMYFRSVSSSNGQCLLLLAVLWFMV